MCFFFINVRVIIPEAPMKKIAKWTSFFAVLFFSFGGLRAESELEQSEPAAPYELFNMIKENLAPVEGPGRGSIGEFGEIEIPEGFFVIGRNETQQLMKMFGNLLTQTEQGTLAPKLMDWFVVFEFEEIGYVKDDEKDSLDPDAMLKQMQSANKEGNKVRKNQGLPTLEMVGWAVPPRYNPDSQNLEWATLLRGEEGEEVVNHNTRLLGRRGTMNLTLVIDPASLEKTLPVYQTIIAGYSFKEGHRYAEYREGDTLAKVGLSALVLGGGLAVAAKSGLLQKLLKPILIGIVVVGGVIAKFFGRNKA